MADWTDAAALLHLAADERPAFTPFWTGKAALFHKAVERPK
jgi:hypothetical protein